MVEKIICDASDLIAIANAVRASTGETELYTVPELSVAAVNAIEGASAGVSLATCTVQFTSENAASGLQGAIYLTLNEQGEIVSMHETFSRLTSKDLQVLCNSIICLKTNSWYCGDIYAPVVYPSKASTYGIGESGRNELFYVYAGPGETVHIHNEEYNAGNDAPL